MAAKSKSAAAGVLPKDVIKQTRSIHNEFDKDAHNARLVQPVVHKPISAAAEADLATLMRDGYVIIKNVLSPDEIKNIKTALEPFLGDFGRNIFEGVKTQRVYGLLGKSRAFDGVCTHPRILELLSRTLLPNPLITAYQAIKIHPGEARQPFHYDDQFMNVPRPRRGFSVATIWAIDEFTADNGATVVIPGSHKWGEAPPPKDVVAVPAVMPAGSVIFFLSTLWHGGGANTSTKPRLALTTQYCEPWIRPQENQMLVVPPEVVPTLSPVLQSMIGYSVHPPFIGQHPLKKLAEINKAAKEKKLAARL